MANLLINTTVGGNAVITTSNIGSYALTSIPATIGPTNINIGNAIYFGGGNNYLNWDGARINSNVGIQSTSDMRAPIFYDSADTSYYLDPNGNSVLTTATFNVNASSIITLTSAGTNASMIKAGAGDELYIGGNNTWQMRFSGANVLMDNGGYLQNNESLRAPIFYDSNDTGYYLDPNGLSVLSHIRLNNNWANAGINQGAINIRGQYPSMQFRNTVSDSMWLRHMDASGTIQHYYASDGVDSSNWSIKHSMFGNGNFSSVGTHTASQFIGSGAGLTGTASSLSVNYATGAGALGGYSLDTMKKYIWSRGENLLSNGTGLMGNNTNFTSFTFDGSQAYFSSGSFRYTGQYQAPNTDELMPVNPEKRYRLDFWARTTNGQGAYYAYLNFFDVDGNTITAVTHMYYANTLTTLAQTLNPGDTVVYLTSAANWENGGTAGVSTHIRSFIFWNYVNSFGYAYPPETYSQNWYGGRWDPGAVNYATNTITLISPWNGPSIASGTKLSNGSAGGTYKYIALGYTIVPTTWTNYVGIMDGVDYSGTNAGGKFPPGTASAKLGFLTDYNASGDTIFLANLFVGVDTDYPIYDKTIGNTKIEKSGAFYGTIFYDSNNTSYYLDPNSTSNLYRVDAASQMRAPIFYDSQDTNYYLDPNSTSRLVTVNADTLRSYSNVYTDGNYGNGLVGLYSAERYQGVFAMGDSYKLAANGTTTGNLYGIAWTHTNVGGQSKSGLGHQALFMDNGVTQTAIGSGIWTSGLITTTSYGTSSNWNTAFGWGNHASAGYLTGITSGQVTGALGYTPYNSSNPSGYITSSGSISGSAGSVTNGVYTNVTNTIVNGDAAALIVYGASSYNAAAALHLGGWSTDTTYARIRTSNGNLHIDTRGGAGNVYQMYFNHYSSGDMYFGNGGGTVYIYGGRLKHSNNTDYVYNSGTWSINVTGSSGSAGNATNLSGLGTIQSTSTGTSYTTNYQVRENSGGSGNTNEIYAPQLAFHWGGVVASSIMMESSGRMAIRNNPGGSYENFIAAVIYSSGYGDSTQWNTAYGWGNHASAGYQAASTAITTSNIGSQSVSYATTSGALTSMNISQFTNNSGYITGYTETDTLATVTGRGSTTSSSITAERYRGNNSLILNSFTTVNPSSNVFLYSQPNDRDSWIYLDSADTGSNWGIYHRQIDSAVGGMEGNSIGFIGGGANGLRAYIGLSTGNGYFAGTLSASNLSGTNTGDQTNISGNAATATYATTAGSAPANGGNSSTVGGYSVSVGASANTIPTRNGSGYLIPESWIQLNGIYGLYSPTNGAHLRPNDGSYGPWLVTGTRNGWNGIEFNASNGNVSLMVNPTSNTTGFHNNAYGWQFYWESGTLYCHKNAYGAGAQATVLDSSNYSSWAQPIASAINTGNIGSQSVSNASTAGGLAVHSSRNNEANKIVRTDANGYIQAGWINTPSGVFSSAITKIYCSDDDYVRFQTPATFISNLGLITTSNIGSQSVSYATTAGTANAVAWGNVSSKPSYVMYYQGFTLDANTMDANSTGFTYSVNAPYTGPIARFSEPGYSLQLNAAYSGSGTGIAFRTRNGDAGSFNPWRVLLNDANYTAYSPSLAGTGASGTWSISVTGSAGSVAWTNVSSRPTALSQFTNDLGNYGGFLTSITAHTHAISDVTGLQTALDSKQASLGFTPYNSTNPSGYITGISFANVSSKPTTISGYGITDAITTANIGSQSVTNSAQLNGLSKIQLWNNSGQGHSTYQTFGAIPNFGVWFMQGSTANDTPQSGSQYYVQTQGLGNDYAYGTYGLMTAVARDHARKYTYYRTQEGGSWGSWTKAAAGYADEAGVLTSMNISQFTNNSGYITGINSGNVTTALGFTPYNATNPSGYITSSASISGTASNITAYTINQSVGTGNSPTFAGLANTGGWYSYNDDDRNPGSANHYPTTSARSFRFSFVGAGSVGAVGNYAGLLQFNPWDGTTSSTGDSSYQLAFVNQTGVNGSGNPGLRLRKGIDSTWGAFCDILTSVNYTSYSPTLTGTGASGTWSISVSGNAATATNVAYSGLTGTVPTWNQNTTGSAATVGGYAPSGSVGANTVVIRDANNYIYAHYINSNVSETENPTINSFYTSNGDGWLRKSSVAHVKSQLGLGSMAYESSGTYQTVSGAINTGNIASQSVSYATVSQQLTKFGDIYGQDWNSYFITAKLIVSNALGHTGANRPSDSYGYGTVLSYGETGGPLMQMYFPEDVANTGGAYRALAYRSGYNGSWSAWKTVVNQVGNTCTVAGSNGTGLQVHSNVGYNQNPLTYFLLRGQADSSWKTFKILLTGDAGGQDIEFRRIAENSTDARMFYVPRGLNQVIFDYTVVQPSDSRLKDNLTLITTPVDKIKSLRGVEFDWNSGEHVGTHDVGLIAQDVEAVLPEAVTTQEDGYKNLAYTKVIPLLVEAMKEQQTMIEALRAEIELLKNK
jgi:hypothetical protein